MAEKLTTIELPHSHVRVGYADWGECSPEHMVKLIREYGAHLRQKVEAIEGAADEDFRIEVARGVHVRRDRRILQAGGKKGEG